MLNTREKLVTEASRLLDAGGESAVTLRAVGQAVGVSHNAPYRHFKDRSALLAAIAQRDFVMLTRVFDEARVGDAAPFERLKQALGVFIEYGRNYPARYRLLFSDPAIGAAGGALEETALGTLTAFTGLVADSQISGSLPLGSTAALAGLIYATTHGMIDLELGGRLREPQAFSNVGQGLSLLLSLLNGRDTALQMPSGTAQQV